MDANLLKMTTSQTDEIVARVREIIHADRHLIVREVEEGIGIAAATCHAILREDIGYETCVNETCALSLDCVAEGRSRVNLC